MIEFVTGFSSIVTSTPNSYEYVPNVGRDHVDPLVTGIDVRNSPFLYTRRATVLFENVSAFMGVTNTSDAAGIVITP
ncbi:hypothetical protein TVWG_00026 [Tetraselmis viridis virus N1]|nr:hypothetical protein TVWG_00026 [Tetraselmis viridis virus N1]